MSGMLFEFCAECRSCCHIDTGFPPLEVSLTKRETKVYQSICIETQCPHLSVTGCSLSDDKPFSCSLYPLAYNPGEQKFYYDSECPLMPEYLEQLNDRNSDASVHFRKMQKEVKRLEKTDPKFLQNNFAVDLSYFDLLELR
jgi:Fe-S-cluster containining protein